MATPSTFSPCLLQTTDSYRYIKRHPAYSPALPVGVVWRPLYAAAGVLHANIRRRTQHPSPVTITVMAKKNKPIATSSMHPSRHPEVAQLLEDSGLVFTFHHDDTDDGAIKWRDSAVMGRFRCHNPKCGSHGWSSKRIAIRIRVYRRERYNAKVYHQHCKNCGFLSKPILDDTYAERVAYWLKSWSGISLPKPPHGPKSKKPHHQELCEGCKAGHCPYSDD
ncbi:zinc-binding domain-containing protein [Xylaria flabelliformis]|nr:zinc-binding domain-containing protein [Xylaria flabelliformis]